MGKFHFCKIFFELSFGFEDMLSGLALSCDLDGRAFSDQQVAFSVI